jgi:SAM-dependent methyltransferase
MQVSSDSQHTHETTVSRAKILGDFVRLNTTLSRRIIPERTWQTHGYVQFEHWASIELLKPGTSRVIDLGAGKRFHLSDIKRMNQRIHLIGVDVDAKEMAENDSLDEKLIVSPSAILPVEPDSIDLILSRATIEHLPDVSAFLNSAYVALRPGGRLIATFANKWSTFAILNRVIPSRLKASLLRNLLPEAARDLGFETHYEDTSNWRFEYLAKQSGFLISVNYASYHSSGYFAFFTPLCILDYILNCAKEILGTKNLSAYNTFVLEKPVTATKPWGTPI